MSDTSNHAARAKFANETGYTVEEWLTRWEAGLVDQVAHAGRYQAALEIQASDPLEQL